MQKIADKAQAMQAAPAKNDIKSLIKKMEPEIAKALPSVITPERFTRIALSALSTNPKLAECTPRSFLAAMMTSAQLGLEVNTPLGQCFLIPYLDGKTKMLECQFQLGYQGLKDLAYRSGNVIDIEAKEVRENDEFTCKFGLHPELNFVKKIDGPRGKVIAYYAKFATKDGGFGFDVMGIDEIREHRDAYSKAAAKGSSPWLTNFDEMAKKTVLKKVLKYAPMSTEFAREYQTDETIKTKISEDMFSEPDETITAEFVDTEPETEQAEQQ